MSDSARHPAAAAWLALALLLGLLTSKLVYASEEPEAPTGSTFTCADQTPAPDCIKQLQQQLDESIKKQKDYLMINGYLRTNLSAAQAPVEVAYQQSLVAYFEYQSAFMNYGKSFYQWEIWVSSAILVVVIIIVFAGLGFSGYQLRKALTISNVQPTAELELSATKLRITSSVVGVVVLAISLAFFYLFVVEVYPINGPVTPIKTVISKPLPPPP